MEGEWSCYRGDQSNGGKYYDCKTFGRGVHLKERGHYQCKIWESMSKQRTLTAKFDRGVDLQGREDIMRQKVWKSGRFKVGKGYYVQNSGNYVKAEKGEGIMTAKFGTGPHLKGR